MNCCDYCAPHAPTDEGAAAAHLAEHGWTCEPDCDECEWARDVLGDE